VSTVTLSGPDPSDPYGSISVSFLVPSYDPLAWQRRARILVGGAGTVTVQDMGVTVKDVTMRLTSSEPTLTSADVVALYSLWFQQGAVCTLTDYLGNSVDVFFKDFHPKVAVNTRWTYEIGLVVLSVTKLLGQTAVLPG